MKSRKYELSNISLKGVFFFLGNTLVLQDLEKKTDTSLMSVWWMELELVAGNRSSVRNQEEETGPALPKDMQPSVKPQLDFIHFGFCISEL